jgi:hypothetical protein
MITHKKISEKLKIGHLIFDKRLKKIVIVKPEILIEIIEDENNSNSQNYFLIILKENWLTKIFNFRKQYLNSQYMTVFTSNSNGFKIHERQGIFSLGYIFKEKMNNIHGMTGNLTYKPHIFFVNELMDYLFLIKREQFNFSEKDLQKINKLIGKSIKYLEYKNN